MAISRQRKKQADPTEAQGARPLIILQLIRTPCKEATFSDDFFGFTIPCFPGGSSTISARACQIKSRRPASFEFQIKHKSLNMCIMKYLTILCPYLLSIQSKRQSHSCQRSPLSLQFPRRPSFEEALSHYWAGPGGDANSVPERSSKARSSESSAYNILMIKPVLF